MFKFANGNPKEGTPDPKGADWESLITDKYNELVGGSDKGATSAAQKFYPTYGEAALKVATSFNTKLKINCNSSVSNFEKIFFEYIFSK